MKTQHIVAAVAITLLHLPSLAAADGSPDHTSHPPKPVTDANITGHVRNATTQEHLPYISITVKGTTLGTTTDATGHYMLKNLPAGDLVLEASMLGYKTEEKKVTTQADKLLEVNCDLEEDAVALDEVVVSATRNETSKKEAPIIVNVSSAKLFEGTSSATLAEGMNFQPGLRFNTFSPNYKHRWEIFASGQGIRRASYYGAQKNPDAYGHTNDKTFAIGTQYTYTMDRLWFMPAELTAGIEYNYNDLHDYYMSLDRDFTQQTHVTGGYLQNEWKTEKLSLLVGARLDKHNLMEHVVLCPRANIRYSPSEQVGLRVSYSSGYRAPQAYNEDLHIEAVGGALALIRLAKGLKPEYSHSVSASADLYHSFGRLQANLLVEGFYTMLNNVFTLVRIGENEDGSIVYWERRNGSGATVAGVNFEGKIGIPHRFELQLGYTLQSSRYDTPERWSDQLAPQRKMFRAPDHYGYLTSLFDITPRFKASLFGTYTGSMLVKHILSDGTNETDLEQNTPSFWDIGIKLAYTFRIGKAVNLEVNTGVKNIFDAYQTSITERSKTPTTSTALPCRGCISSV